MQVVDCEAVLKCLVVSSRIVADEKVRDVTNDSRKVKQGDLFVAIDGAASDGHRFIDSAIDSGAQTIVYTDDISFAPGVNYIRVCDGYAAYAVLCEAFFNFPARQFALTGVTGTNGKTTIACLLHHLLETSAGTAGLVSTVTYSYGENHQSASRTTPEAYQLQQLFRQMADFGCENVVMEVSSHGLAQSRTGNADFSVGIFTNLTGDHLDYHGTMDEYFKAKKLLFTDCLANDGVAVINIDDAYGVLLAGECDTRTITYGRSENATLRIVNVESTIEGSAIKLIYNGEELILYTTMIGDYNASNVTAVAGAALSLGVSLQAISDYFSPGTKHSVPGRLESFSTPNGAQVFVDYAHTDDALSNVLKTLKPLTPGVLRVVFGCGGDRDVTKRPRMGRVAAAYAGSVVVTSDNPRSEEPEKIIEQILDGISEHNDLQWVVDRKDAIRTAVLAADSGDVVLIAGKGHETYQEIDGVFYDFDDREIVRSLCST